ncbi:hypothetical protein [Peribacillus frigoritolerans]|uniref:hypothetical protein n=1 Tax=Peribacillus frigoritolerans TaxID=450367 RepID=UPI0032E3E39D
MVKEKKIKLKKPNKWWVWVLAIVIIANIAGGGAEEEVEEKASDTAELREEAPRQSLLLQGFSQVSNFLFFHTLIMLKL